MPHVKIKWFKGRDYTTKARTIKLGTKAVCESNGCNLEDISVII